MRYPGDWDEVYFRDYLIAHPETTAEYAALKSKLKDSFEHDRDGYTDAKGEFIRAIHMRLKIIYELFITDNAIGVRLFYRGDEGGLRDELS